MAITAPLLWLDGTMTSSSEAGAPLMGHAAQRGSLVFDVGSFHPTSTTNGTALFRAREHVERFLRSSRIVGLEIPFSVDALVEAAVRVVHESGFGEDAEGMIRWSAFFAATEPDLVPRDGSVKVAVAAQKLQDPRPADHQTIKISIFDDARKAAPNVLSPETKAAGAYLGPMIAKRRAIAAGSDDVVLLDCDGDIAEAPIANTFAVVKGVLWTPPLGRILPGITRDSVLTLAKELGIPIKEERLPLDVFLSSDEAFLTSTSLPLAAIGSINGKPLAGAAPGPITAKLTDALIATQHGADKNHAPWLTFVRS